MANKVAVISGATSGIGLACANKFASEGYKVYCLARSKPEGYKYEFIFCDVTKEDEVVSAVSIINERETKVDVVICNAGRGIGGPLENCDVKESKSLFDLNFFGAFSLAKAFIPKFKEQGEGRMLFISSVGAIFPLPFQAFYSASKSALETMAYAWRLELKPLNIKIGCILPGDTTTNFTAVRKNIYGDSSYDGRDTKSIKKMEHDEEHGMSPNKVAKIIYKSAIKRRVPIRKVVGFKYKFLVCLDKFLPKRVVHWFVGKMYA